MFYCSKQINFIFEKLIFLKKIRAWLKLLLKTHYYSSYIIKSHKKIKNDYVIIFLDKTLGKEFSIEVTQLFNNARLMNKFDKDDVLEIGKLYANSVFLHNHERFEYAG